MEFIIPSLYITHVTHIMDDDFVVEWLTNLLQLD